MAAVPLPETTRVVPLTPRSRTYYVEVTHHGWFAGAMVKGKRHALDVRDALLAHARAQCATSGPLDKPADPLAADGESRCPDA